VRWNDDAPVTAPTHSGSNPQRSSPVPYSVWCNDRLVGETDLDYIANTSEHKMGDFEASEYGEQLIPVLMAPRKAVCAHAPMEVIERLYTTREQVKLELRASDGRVIPTDHIEITDLEWLLSLAGDIEDDWQSDLAMAEAELAMELEPPEDEEGEQLDVIPPEWLDDEDEDALFDEFDVPDIELEDPNAPPPNFPRYQIQVTITNGG
jgi:hypothetical protein